MSEWVRLPGLFLWEEVCEVFAEEAGFDDAWRFTVALDSVGPEDEPLYVVHAAPGRSPEPALIDRRDSWRPSMSSRPPVDAP